MNLVLTEKIPNINFFAFIWHGIFISAIVVRALLKNFSYPENYLKIRE